MPQQKNMGSTTATIATTSTHTTPAIAASTSAPAAAAPTAAPAAPATAPRGGAQPGVEDHLRNALAAALWRTGPGAPPGGGEGREGGGGGGREEGGGSRGQPAPIPLQQLVPVPLAADIWVVGMLPHIFRGERDKVDTFINKLLGYLLLNTNVPRFKLPIWQVALTLTLIKGPHIDWWVWDMTTWLWNLDPINDNIPQVWEHFTATFEEQFMDSMKTQHSRQRLKKLQFKFPDIDQYITDFKDLANLSGYTVGNDETINLFLKGFKHAWDILGGILTLPIPVTYYAIKYRAISVTKLWQLINVI